MCEFVCHSLTEKNSKKKKLRAGMICLLLLLSWQFFVWLPIQAVAAQKVTNLKQMEDIFKQSIKKGENATVNADFINFL